MGAIRPLQVCKFQSQRPLTENISTAIQFKPHSPMALHKEGIYETSFIEAKGRVCTEGIIQLTWQEVDVVSVILVGLVLIPASPYWSPLWVHLEVIETGDQDNQAFSSMFYIGCDDITQEDNKLAGAGLEASQLQSSKLAGGNIH